MPAEARGDIGMAQEETAGIAVAVHRRFAEGLGGVFQAVLTVGTTGL